VSRTECAVQDGANQVGLPGAVEGATCHPASRRRAKPLQVPTSPPQHPRKQDASSARARTECAVQDGAKQVGLPGHRWSCHLPPSLTETRRAPTSAQRPMPHPTAPSSDTGHTP